jgi:hypothetical protein
MEETLDYPSIVAQLQVENEVLRGEIKHLHGKLGDITRHVNIDLGWFHKLSSQDKMYLLLGVCIVAYTFVFIIQAVMRMI